MTKPAYTQKYHFGYKHITVKGRRWYNSDKKVVSYLYIYKP